MPVEPPPTVEELTPDYLSAVAGKMLGDVSLRVTEFAVRPDPFEFPRFGEKQFFEIAFGYRGRRGEGRSTMILRVLPPMDAVMMLTGDTDHRELRAFETGLYQQVPKTFHIPYLDIVHRPEQGQYWVFVEDVRPEMERLGMHAALPDGTIRLILSHLAAFHAAFWQRSDILSQPWLMRLHPPAGFLFPR